MSLAKKISEDVKSALKGGDKKKLSIARYIYSELKNFLIKENLDRDVIKLSDENVIKIIKTQLKQKKESLEFALQTKVQSKKQQLNLWGSLLDLSGLHSEQRFLRAASGIDYVNEPIGLGFDRRFLVSHLDQQTSHKRQSLDHIVDRFPKPSLNTKQFAHLVASETLFVGESRPAEKIVLDST